jgi:membrane fusion protein, multidrug efflux system
MSNYYTNDFALRAATVAAFAVLALGACHRSAPPAAPAAMVVALPVRSYPGSNADGIRYPVEAAARYSNSMSFRVGGKLIERTVRLGDSVHRGQVIARLDALDAQKQASSAQAAREAADHRLVFAKQQLDRDQAQFAQNLIAVTQWEQTQDAFAAAAAGREQAAAQQTVAHNTLEYNTLIADHDGVITSENADTGQVVSAGQAIYGLAWTGDTDVTLDAAAGDVGRMSIGQTAAVTFPALPGRHFEARVREISPAADAQSRTYRVKLTLLQPSDAVRFGMTGDATLAPIAPARSGPSRTQSASVTSGTADAPGTSRNSGTLVTSGTSGNSGTSGTSGIAGNSNTSGGAGTLGTSSTSDDAGTQTSAVVFKLPATALFHQGKEPAVWIIRPGDSTLELRAVTISGYTDRSALVTSGLKDGDTVVQAGVHTVYAGQRVQAVKPLFQGEGEDTP